MKVNKNLKKVGLFVIVFVLVLIALFVREQNFYNQVLVERAFEVFPTSESREGISFQMLTKYYDENGEKLSELKLIPGQVLNGTLFVKNNFLEEKLVSFLLFNDFSLKTDLHFNIEFSEQSFVLLPGEWRFIDFTLEVPEDFSLGNYYGQIGVRTDDSFAYNKSVEVVTAVAVDFKIEVQSDEASFVVQNLVPLDMTPYNVAKGYLISDLKKLSGYGFAILALIFLYYAFMADKRNVKNR